MRYKHILSATALVCCIPLIAQAQIAPPPSGQTTSPGLPTTPVRDRSATKGTSVIRGQLLDVTSGAPIRRARVSIAGSFENPMNAPVSQTDGEGRFEFREVAAGKYTFSATKTGYLSLTATNNGKRVPPLPVGEGETVDRIVLRLARGGVISGQVFDDFGDAIVGAEVRVMRFRYNNGTRQLMPAGANGFPVATDDLGSFRVYGLEPGEYYVLARPGRDFVAMTGTTPDGDGPAPTYYPGTTTVAEARRITVRPGRETQGISFQVAVARLARVRGRVLSSTGEPFAGNVSVFSSEPMVSGQGGFSGSGFVRPDGTFEVANIPPGSYTLVARQNDFGNSSTAIESGRALISVNGETLNDIVIATSRGGTIRGRVTTDEGTPLPFAAGSLSLYAQPVNPNTPPAGRGAAKTASDWTFEITGIFDRVYLRPNMFSVPGGSNDAWTVKAVVSDGQDVSDTGIEVRPGNVLDDVVIVYTRKQSRLTGRLLDDRGEAAEGWIILFSADESLWKPQSRFVRPARPGPDGVFRIQATPHDNYLVIGVAALEEGQWQDPEFLRSVKELGTRLSIGENETRTHDVKLTNLRQ